MLDRSFQPRPAQFSAAQRISWEHRDGASVPSSSLLLCTFPAPLRADTLRTHAAAARRDRKGERERERERERRERETYTHVDRMNGPSPSRQRPGANSSSRLAPRSSAAILKKSLSREQNTMMAAIEWRVKAARVCPVFPLVFPDVPGNAHTVPSKHASCLRRRAWHDHFMTA